ncbi:hypothetical protein M9H77_18270 [Catharanthus roseus]|uniref:Uncharacterized protein n=1 Tax=Catharanthus roseus TaxID=4058 RepID=A0ACC0B6Y4_CATRO|nr:hypothetical protein M9H77_18270 [Catharanthus roseus]
MEKMAEKSTPKPVQEALGNQDLSDIVECFAEILQFLLQIRLRFLSKLNLDFLMASFAISFDSAVLLFSSQSMGVNVSWLRWPLSTKGISKVKEVVPPPPPAAEAEPVPELNLSKLNFLS